MASAIMHLCIAKEVNKYLQMDERYLLLGSIAPDLSKEFGETKEISHFLDHSNEDDLPNIDRFLKKYRQELNNPFTMGYFIHLLTDKYWFRDYINNYISRYTHDKEKKALTYSAIRSVIYDDYTNINIDLIDHYNLSLDLFFNEFPLPKSSISEIPINKLPVLIDKLSLILKEAKEEKTFIFDTSDIYEFISNSVKYIIKDIQMLNINSN